MEEKLDKIQKSLVRSIAQSVIAMTLIVVSIATIGNIVLITICIIGSIITAALGGGFDLSHSVDTAIIWTTGIFGTGLLAASDDIAEYVKLKKKVESDNLLDIRLNSNEGVELAKSMLHTLDLKVIYTSDNYVHIKAKSRLSAESKLISIDANMRDFSDEVLKFAFDTYSKPTSKNTNKRLVDKLLD